MTKRYTENGALSLTGEREAGNIWAVNCESGRDQSRLKLFPLTAERKKPEGHLSIGGCDVVALARRYGTPLYIFDEATLRGKCREVRGEFAARYPDSSVVYAAKAFLNKSLAALLKGEGLGLDVVSGGELAVAQAVDFPMDRVYFHGNNKAAEELETAVKVGVGRVVVDNLQELAGLDSLASEAGVRQDILFRLTPGVDPHSHQHTSTGVVDSKFGFSMTGGVAEGAVREAMKAKHINLVGLHFHLGSPVMELGAYGLALDIVLRFASEMSRKYGFVLRELSAGGGFAAQYTVDKPVPSIADYATAVCPALKSKAGESGLPLPRLVVEPGRSIVARAGVAVYKVGSVKEIPGVRRYVSVDGGMGDNIRPELYGARYEAVLANRCDGEEATVTIAGRFCESGDILARDVSLVSPVPGDLIAMPTSGAYAIPMASNYNLVPRPAIVMVNEGKSRIIRRRESYGDLMRLDRV